MNSKAFIVSNILFITIISNVILFITDMVIFREVLQNLRTKTEENECLRSAVSCKLLISLRIFRFVH